MEASHRKIKISVNLCDISVVLCETKSYPEMPEKFTWKSIIKYNNFYKALKMSQYRNF